MGKIVPGALWDYGAIFGPTVSVNIGSNKSEHYVLVEIFKKKCL